MLVEVFEFVVSAIYGVGLAKSRYFDLITDVSLLGEF